MVSIVTSFCSYPNPKGAIWLGESILPTDEPGKPWFEDKSPEWCLIPFFWRIWPGLPDSWWGVPGVRWFDICIKNWYVWHLQMTLEASSFARLLYVSFYECANAPSPLAYPDSHDPFLIPVKPWDILFLASNVTQTKNNLQFAFKQENNIL